MAFHEIQFPINVSKLSTGGPSFRHSIVELDSGAVTAVAKWPSFRMRYNAAPGVRTKANAKLVRDFYIARGGLSNGWRWKDWDDYSTAADDTSAPAATNASLGSGDGTKILFQLLKTYVSGAQTVTRVLRKPVTGTVVAALNGTPTTSFTVDTSTGIISFSTPPGAGVAVTAGCEFDVPVMFGAALADDALDVGIIGGEARQIANIPIVEMVGDVVTPDLSYDGAGSYLSFSLDYTLYDFTLGLFVVLNPATNNLHYVLPDLTDMDDGGGRFRILNDHATNSVLLTNRLTGATEATLAGKVSADCCIVTISGAKAWRFLKGTA